MNLDTIVMCFGLILDFFSLVLLVWVAFQLHKLMQEIPPEPPKEPKEREIPPELSAIRAAASAKGAEARAANREMRLAAMAEGRQLMASLPPDIISNPAAQEAAKGQLAALAMKYPKVADEVADGLFREFKIEEPFKGIIKGVVGNALMNPQAVAGKKEVWYGIEV